MTKPKEYFVEALLPYEPRGRTMENCRYLFFADRGEDNEHETLSLEQAEIVKKWFDYNDTPARIIEASEPDRDAYCKKMTDITVGGAPFLCEEFVHQPASLDFALAAIGDWRFEAKNGLDEPDVARAYWGDEDKVEPIE